MSQFFIGNPGGTSGPIETLSAQGGAATPPNGTNFDFSGTSSGAILFSITGNGLMKAAVQVDGTTISVNGSDQLTALGGFNWIPAPSNAFIPATNTGYTLVSSLATTITVPVSAVTGTTARYYFKVARQGPGAFIIALNALDQLQFGDAGVLIGGVDTLTSNQVGDSLEIVALTQNVAGNTWMVVAPFGNITIT